MFSVQDLMSRLTMMPDAQLQQYAAANKTDPYVLSLAMSEHNRRAQMRNAAQALQAGQVPPMTVADQALMSMQPQPSMGGIAALPADVDVAEGGIAGYAEGGDVRAERLERARRALLAQQLGYVPSDEELAQSSTMEWEETKDPSLLYGNEGQGSTPIQNVKPLDPKTALDQVMMEELKAPDKTPVAAPTGSGSRGLAAIASGNASKLSTRDIATPTRALMGQFQQDEAARQAELARRRKETLLPPEDFAERIALFQESKDSPDVRQRIRGMSQLEAAAAILKPNQHWMQALVNGLVTQGKSEGEAIKELEESEMKRREALAMLQEAKRAAARDDAKAEFAFTEAASRNLSDVARTMFTAETKLISDQAGLTADTEKANAELDLRRRQLAIQAQDVANRGAAYAARGAAGRATAQDVRRADALAKMWNDKIKAINEDPMLRVGQTREQVVKNAYNELKAQFGGSPAWELFESQYRSGGGGGSAASPVVSSPDELTFIE